MLFRSLVWSQWRWGGASTGIPVTYFIGLAMIHVPGAALYLDPNYEFFKPETIETGLQIATLGVLGFAFGVMVGGTRARPFSRPRLMDESNVLAAKASASELNRLAWFFLFVGFAVEFAVRPFLGALSLTALLLALSQLNIVGTCLGLYAARLSGDRGLLRNWLIVAASFPIVTVLASAFLGYGIVALLVVASFAFSLFRPRLWSVIPFALAVYIGLSVYVTYARDRGEYRAAAWEEGATLEQRAERLINTFSKFEFVDFDNLNHKKNIDLRLNQNDLVGAAESHIASGRADFALGETLWVALIAPIPRILWPDKPVFGGSGNLVSDYTGYGFAEGTSVGLGQVLEFFINFGWTGEFWCYALFGVVVRRLDLHAGLALRAGEYRRFLLYFMPALGLMQPGGALAEVVASAAAAYFSALLAAVFATRYLMRLREKSSDGTQESAR